MCFFFFFFQAEDGIRDLTVTGVQTCALPISREARDLIENHGVRGFKFHGIMQNIHPADPVGYPIYEVIAAHKLPAIFHTGHSGMGTGLPGGGGVRLKWGQPMLIDDVAVDFPDMKIVLAHPSWQWVDES